MQIAEQIFDIETAKNGLIFFRDGSPAYITKRFDVLKNGKRSLKEDFASLAGKTSEIAGKDFKYAGSYLDIARLIDKYIPAAIVAKERFFKTVVFNYLFSNGDAHLKNFSIIDYEQSGFYVLAPAYDLICTRLHVDDSDFAMNENLYEGDYKHPSYGHFGYHAYDDFHAFAERIGILPHRIKPLLNSFLNRTNEVEDLVQRSFLNTKMKKKYLFFYSDKLKRLQQSLSGKIE
jgi:serine/threonine-protein kinase HipA